MSCIHSDFEDVCVQTGEVCTLQDNFHPEDECDCYQKIDEEDWSDTDDDDDYGNSILEDDAYDEFEGRHIL
jgi:hypothetical protein